MVGARQRGIAVLTAMLVVAIATILAVEIIWRTSLDLQRTESLLTWNQAQQYALGAEGGEIALIRDITSSGATSPVTCDQSWHRGGDFAIEGGRMTSIPLPADLQGRFNLNNLVTARGRKDPVVYQQFQRLLASLDLDQGLADAVVDWIDPDQIPEIEGAEDDYYTGLTPPYRAANSWFTSVSELRSVKGFEAQAYEVIRPHVAALPNAGQPIKINVNTATPAVLKSLGPNVTESNIEQWTNEQTIGGFKDLTDFQGAIDPAMVPYVDFTSNFFGLSVIVSIGTTRLTMYSLLQRSGRDVSVRLRSFDLDLPPRDAACEPREERK
jgi:general secretion pathway protein K